MDPSSTFIRTVILLSNIGQILFVSLETHLSLCTKALKGGGGTLLACLAVACVVTGSLLIEVGGFFMLGEREREREKPFFM